ncbi:MAG TPA: arsenic resistance N-acetyltransferase ArsN2, partial [Gemmatimonadales bacterium]|nr:arsenic resistance N-acetyltransferase ArsN2 [Gemmatimonadales bacterium]
MDFTVTPALPADLPAVVELLEAARLPHDDVTTPMLAHYLLAKRGAALLGVIGLEPFGGVGLLRSLAVASSRRGRGLGIELTRALEAHARGMGVVQLYLLTTTAERFFGKLGYRSIPRGDAPDAIHGTLEYRELCASTSVCMVKVLGAQESAADRIPHSKERPMTGVPIARPAADEYAPYYARYIEQVPEGAVLELLERQIGDTAALAGTVGDRDADFRYADGKWSVKEVFGHVADTERIFGYRALCFARGETITLPGFDENEYVARAKFAGRRLSDLVAEFRAVRAATVALFAGLDAEELARRGRANDNPYSVRSLAFIIAGHERHHATILAERYL